VLEIVINGTDAGAIAAAMRLGIDAACREGVVAITRGNYGGKAGPPSFPFAQDHGGGHGMSGGLVARLKSPLQERADFAEVLSVPWTTLSAGELAQRPVYLEREGRVPLGDLFDLKGEPAGRIRLTGDLERADRVGAGLSEGEVTVEGSVGQEAGMALVGERSISKAMPAFVSGPPRSASREG